MNIRVVDHPDGWLDFIRHPDGKILVRTQSDARGCLWVKYADKEILPDWPETPSWYPVEQAVSDAIHMCHGHYCDFEKCDELAPVRIQGIWICTKHIKWAMDLAFKPVKEAMKTIGERP